MTKLEHTELTDILRTAGYGELVDALLWDDKVYARVKGRINVSALARRLGKHYEQVRNMLASAKTILEEAGCE